MTLRSDAINATTSSFGHHAAQHFVHKAQLHSIRSRAEAADRLADLPSAKPEGHARADQVHDHRQDGDQPQLPQNPIEALLKEPDSASPARGHGEKAVRKTNSGIEAVLAGLKGHLTRCGMETLPGSTSILIKM